jgi:MFS family permease
VVALLCFSIFLCAYPLGRLDDRYGHRVTFGLGMASLIAGDLVLCASGVWPGAVFAACLLWGVHWAVVQGPMLSVVVGLAPPHLKGTAFGIFYSVMAVTAMAANTMFGSVWHALGATTAFGLSAAIISVALVAMPLLLPASAGRGRGGGAAPGGVKVAPA